MAPSSSTQLPPPAFPPNPASFLSTPYRQLTSTTDALLSDVLPDATRTTAPRPSPILPTQTYIMRNNHTIYDRGENTIFAPPPTAPPPNEDFFASCTPLYKASITRDGSILGYLLRDAATKQPLLKVHFHGNTKSALSRTFKAFVRSPVPKWDVENYGLFADLPDSANLGLIQDVFPDNRVFFPSPLLSSTPRLEMQNAAALGVAYYFAVTDVPQPVGEVTSDVLGRFVPRSETYTVVLRNCTREEALLWLTMVVATDMKRRKSQNVQYGRSLLPVYV